MLPLIIVITLFFSMIWYTLFYILSVSPAQLERKIGEKSYKICALLRKISFAGMGLCILSEILYFFFPLNMGIPERIINGMEGWIISIIVGLLLFIFASVIIIKVSKVAKDSFVPKKENE